MSKAEKTREYIIEKIAPVFNAKGYAGTSLSDMTEATGLTKGSIYGNFANKDEVALAAFDFNFKNINRVISAEIGKQKSFKAKLLVYVSIYDGLLKNPRTRAGCAILNTAIESDDTHPGLRQKACQALISWKNNIVQLIEKGINAGEFHKRSDPEQAALTLIALIEGGIMIAKLTGKLNYRRKVMDSVRKWIDDME